jgi:hypothetical protein
VHLVGRHDLLCRDVTDAEMADLALRDDVGHRADALLDRHAGIGEMQVPQVDGLDPEPAQARLGGLARALGPRLERPDLAWVPITDVDPLRIVLAWCQRDSSPLLAAFAAVVRELAG